MLTGCTASGSVDIASEIQSSLKTHYKIDGAQQFLQLYQGINYINTQRHVLIKKKKKKQYSTNTHTSASPLEIHKHLMSVPWVAVCLTLLTPFSYCHTSHRTLLTVAWQGGDKSVCVCQITLLCLRILAMWVQCTHTLYAHMSVIEWVFEMSVDVCAWPPCVSICVFICACVSAWVFNMVVKCLSRPISHLPSAQMNWHVAKPNRHKDRAEGITMQLSSAVCPDPVWGPLLSADSNELPRD